MDLKRIRPAVKQDLDQAAEITQQAARREFAQYGSLQEINSWCSAVRGNHRKRLDDSNSLMVVAELKKGIVATGYATKIGNKAYVGGIYSIQQGRGIGREILINLLLWAKQDPRLNSLEADVFEGSKSWAFLTGLGLAETSRELDPAGFFKDARIIRMQGELLVASDLLQAS